MNRVFGAFGLALLSGIMLLPAQAQEPRGDGVEVPDSSLEGPSDHGKRAHTNHRILVTSTAQLGLAGKSPAQIRSFYGLPSAGGGGIIAIVDAYDYPSALSDFNTFSTQF